ncbi:branched-chain amino acid transport system ATP-binding protein [Rhodoligotrophos appendicifer]|uniref:ABC transporter ATP-binding protein n=1 Tax=Rhodoligotrophos appendicifer TaxID=987056 RepID=UPI0011849D3F|nr:ABC transporter ATP-binding protein [Rhodoligotrophos appendicifer]
MTGIALEVEGISLRFGGVVALQDVTFGVRQGAVHGLIGPNGAGKTTLLNCISRIVEPQSGAIRFGTQNVLKVHPENIAHLGIARTFQNFGLIGGLTVRDNVMAGLHSVHPCRLMDELVLLGRRNRFEREMRVRAEEALQRTGLVEIADQEVSSLSYGMRKAVELARAMAVEPKLLLLDEPTAGLNAGEMNTLRDRLLALRAEAALTIIVITHHLEFLAGVADAVTVLDLGRTIASGTPAEVQADPRVIAAYIGEGD